jgi:hypothetical protein
MQFDSLGMEKNHFETGVTDPDSLNGTESLTDYPDPEEDARCAASGELVNTQDIFVRQGHVYQNVLCHTCGKTVYAAWRKRANGWFKLRHFAAPLVSEGPVQ